MPVAFSMREYAGGRPSQSSVARRPSPCTPTLLGTEGVLRCCVCCVVDFCLYAAVLRMERCADLVSVFFGTYSGTLGRSGPCILRYLWWYAGPIWSLYSSIFMVVRWAGLLRRRGDYYLGCGRWRYCGRACCLSRRRVLYLAIFVIPFTKVTVVSPVSPAKIPGYAELSPT